MATITSANSILMLTVANLFNSPIQLQGFAADDIFTAGRVNPVETIMGADGKLSGGWTPAKRTLTIAFQADSDSNDIFDQWQAAEDTAMEAYTCQLAVTLPSISSLFTCSVGFKTAISTMPDGKKVLQPRQWELTFQNIVKSPA